MERCFGAAVVAAASGCAPPVDGGMEITDQFTRTAHICNWPAYRARWATDAWAWRVEGPWSDTIPSYPSMACVDAVLEDFHVDLDAFAEVYPDDDPYETVFDPGRAAVGSRLGGILGAARYWMFFAQGDVDDLEASALVPQSFVDQVRWAAASSGVRGVGAAQYNWATSLIYETVPGVGEHEGASAWMVPDTHTLGVESESWGYDAIGAQVIMHEVRHLYGPPHGAHQPCNGDLDRETCDDVVDGPLGFGVASMVVPYDLLTDELIRQTIRSVARLRMEWINAMTDDEGELFPAWDDARHEVLPE